MVSLAEAWQWIQIGFCASLGAAVILVLAAAVGGGGTVVQAASSHCSKCCPKEKWKDDDPLGYGRR